MKVEIFTTADFCQDYMGKMNIVGTFDVYNSAVFPLTVPMFCVPCKLRFTNDEAGNHNVIVRLTDPNSNEIGQPINININFVPSLVADSSAIHLPLTYLNQVSMSFS